MVYRGKPSEGCHSCRQRRIKCDQKRPGCTQCSRSWQKCPGYRDKLDVLFKDETKTIARKVTNRRKQSRTSSRNSVCSSGGSSVGNSLASSPSSRTTLSPTPSIVINDCALACFIHTYMPVSHFDYLAGLLNSVHGESPLAKAACASAVVYFSAEHGDITLLQSARHLYSEALLRTNQALSTPKEATKDETLAAILLLSLFETFMHDGRRGPPKNWTAHVEGAAALLKLRGDKQFETEIGKYMFYHVTTNIRVSAANRRLPLPRGLEQLYSEAVKHYQGEELQWRMEFLQLVEKFTRLRYVVDKQLIPDPQKLVSDLMDLEVEILQNVEKMPQSWHYTVGDLTEIAPGLWLQPMHYANAKVAQIWDSIRMMRIFLNEATHRILNGHSYFGTLTTEELISRRDNLTALTMKTCDQMCREICAGVPNYLHVSEAFNRRILLAEVSWLLWPLAVVGECTEGAEDVRQFAIDQLQILGKDARLPQALWAVEMLEEESKNEEWLHIYHAA